MGPMPRKPFTVGVALLTPLVACTSSPSPAEVTAPPQVVAEAAQVVVEAPQTAATSSNDTIATAATATAVATSRPKHVRGCGANPSPASGDPLNPGGGNAAVKPPPDPARQQASRAAWARPHGGRIAPKVIQRIVRAGFNRFRLCYEQNLRN